MQRDAAQVSAAFTSYFERARSLDRLLAQNPAMRPIGVDRSAVVSKTVNARANGSSTTPSRWPQWPIDSEGPIERSSLSTWGDADVFDDSCLGDLQNQRGA